MMGEWQTWGLGGTGEGETGGSPNICLAKNI